MADIPTGWHGFAHLPPPSPPLPPPHTPCTCTLHVLASTAPCTCPHACSPSTFHGCACLRLPLESQESPLLPRSVLRHTPVLFCPHLAFLYCVCPLPSFPQQHVAEPTGRACKGREGLEPGELYRRSFVNTAQWDSGQRSLRACPGLPPTLAHTDNNCRHPQPPCLHHLVSAAPLRPPAWRLTDQAGDAAPQCVAAAADSRCGPDWRLLMPGDVRDLRGRDDRMHIRVFGVLLRSAAGLGRRPGQHEERPQFSA